MRCLTYQSCQLGRFSGLWEQAAGRIPWTLCTRVGEGKEKGGHEAQQVRSPLSIMSVIRDTFPPIHTNFTSLNMPEGTESDHRYEFASSWQMRAKGTFEVHPTVKTQVVQVINSQLFQMHVGTWHRLGFGLHTIRASPSFIKTGCHALAQQLH